MSDIELDAILYYADFLSLHQEGIPITDVCRYFFIHEAPIHVSRLAGLKPTFDEESKYFKQAKTEYEALKNTTDEECAMSFIEDIAFLRACGSVDGERILRFIHQFDSKAERKEALRKYYEHMHNIHYTHMVRNEDGNLVERECAKYVYHFERMLREQGLHQGDGTANLALENTPEEPLL